MENMSISIDGFLHKSGSKIRPALSEQEILTISNEDGYP